MSRTFEDKPAVRAQVPLLVGLIGPSGSGKTMSALRLAAGLARVSQGDTFVVDTEARRALAYADRFKFRHIDMGAPFSPLDYLAAVEHCASKGAKTVVIDSASHMHDGMGGTLESHDRECDRLMEAWRQTREKVQMSAWQKPKAELRRFINTILQMQVNVILCARAREKLKIVPGKNPVPLGFMPILADELVYELSLSCLLYPGSGGVPSWHPEEMGEKAIVKLPEHFKGIFAKGEPLSEAHGEALAKWAAGGEAATSPARPHTPATWKMLRDHLEKAGLSKGEMRDWAENVLARPIENPEALSAEDRTLLAANLPQPGA